MQKRDTSSAAMICELADFFNISLKKKYATLKVIRLLAQYWFCPGIGQHQQCRRTRDAMRAAVQAIRDDLPLPEWFLRAHKLVFDVEIQRKAS